MPNRFFNNVIDLFSGSKAKASDIEAHFTLITTGFDGVQTEMDLKAPANSPNLTGTPAAPTAAPGTSTVQLATTEFTTLSVAVEALARTEADALKAPLASPAFTGAPAAPTAAPGNNSTQLATTAYADAIGAAMIAAGVAADADAVATAADRVQTGLDRIQTGLDRTQTGLDRTATAQAVVDAAALLDQFDDRYLGVKASDPALDNDGNALVAGAIYVNSVSGFLRAFNGSGWVQGISALTGVASLNSMTGDITGIATIAGVETLTNKTITDIVFALTGTTPALTATNGAVQTWTLTAASTPTNALTSGQSIILVITPGAFAITWPSVTWTKQGGSGAAPTLFSAGKTSVVLWMVGAVLYGSHLGDTV